MLKYKEYMYSLDNYTKFLRIFAVDFSIFVHFHVQRYEKKLINKQKKEKKRWSFRLARK